MSVAGSSSTRIGSTTENSPLPSAVAWSRKPTVSRQPATYRRLREPLPFLLLASPALGAQPPGREPQDQREPDHDGNHPYRRGERPPGQPCGQHERKRP